MKPILISGIRPTEALHLGNYLGALKNFVELQNSEKYNCLFFIADYHAITTNFKGTETKKLTNRIIELGKDYLAVGLNPKKSILFIQSLVPEHLELGWIIQCLSPFGQLTRMTQFKQKAKESVQVNAGLFAYPSLMAADILLYNAKYVPVGKDQLQHLEFVRDIAQKFNSEFGKTFNLPEPVLTTAPKILSLTDPSSKMSKSQAEGCLFLKDSKSEIYRKIKSAVTDSGREIKYDSKTKPGISNLLTIYSALSGKPISSLEEEFKGKGYAEFKLELSKLINNSFKPYRQNRKKITNQKVLKIFKTGSIQARKIATKRLNQIKAKIGLKL